MERKRIVLEQLGSVWIYLLKTVSDGSATLCKICKPCAKLRLVQTTRGVEGLPSACLICALSNPMISLFPSSDFLTPCEVVLSRLAPVACKCTRPRCVSSTAKSMFQLPPNDGGWLPQCFWCQALEDFSLYLTCKKKADAVTPFRQIQSAATSRKWRKGSRKAGFGTGGRAWRLVGGIADGTKLKWKRLVHPLGIGYSI